KQDISKYDLGRDKFLEVAWDWKNEYSNYIRKQWEALGISVDYTKERFTLDEGLNEAVNHVFIKMHEDGLIYRGNRIIHWDVEAKTAISNIEVEHEEEMAKLYYLKYPLVEDSNKYLVVATTRPETMFADQAVMIHPEDKRYLSYLGKKVFIPGTNVKIPVIADDYVDKDFGTGVVKVTPAHDANDFEVGVRHNLDMPLCMTEDGLMNEMAFEFQGLERFEARKRVIEKLDKLNLVEKIEDYLTNIGYSERTGVVVEPRLSLQWFIKMDDIAKDSLNTTVNFVPNRFKKIYENWMNNPQDWCISRQLWWGHRIPAWYKDEEVKVQVESPGIGWVQDEDVLDTWFSSALWPFSTLGWPNNTKDFEMFYPNDVLVTGYDIIFFWVARMIFQGRYFTKQDPFKDVLLHGLIRDNQGRKMSKSLGNGVDPMDVIDKYGVDALRYFLTTNSAPGADLRYDVEKVESSWNFINKLWNISRFVMLNLNKKTYEIDYNNLTLSDKWILSRLNEVIGDANKYYEVYNFNETAHVLYNFIWNEFADWYLELSKVSLKDDSLKTNTEAVLFEVLNAILKLLHPFTPFVTDMLYQELTNEDSIIRANWPTNNYYNKES
ncbi:MAG TPA: valine--tRNA ligase, partial [Acholeplasma sp.]|nr:valine--tRNA ligase [Acholeplasma sp.]